MKIILSRKGFDDQYGKIKSPILEDGTLLSLPIPQKNDKITYDQLSYNGKSYLDIIKELNPKWKYPDNEPAHLDPDLRENVIKRNFSWKAIFGQSGAAQGHLKNQKIDVGDIFLFFGSFAQTKEIDGKLTFVKDNLYPNGAHIIFGYLQIGQIIELNEVEDYEKKLDNFTKFHPHADKEYLDEKGKKRVKNCMYVASEKLTSLDLNMPGAGILSKSESRILTKKSMSKSMWDLPAFFKNIKMSYHSEKSLQPGYFKSADKGQEFVIDTMEDVNLKVELERWVTDIIKNH